MVPGLLQAFYKVMHYREFPSGLGIAVFLLQLFWLTSSFSFFFLFHIPMFWFPYSHYDSCNHHLSEHQHWSSDLCNLLLYNFLIFTQYWFTFIRLVVSASSRSSELWQSTEKMNFRETENMITNTFDGLVCNQFVDYSTHFRSRINSCGHIYMQGELRNGIQHLSRTKRTWNLLVT